jgi:hypothetical protein
MDAYSSDLNWYWETLLGLLLSADQTIRAALFLVSDSRLDDLQPGAKAKAFPAQTIMLGRSLLEALGNVMALVEEPASRDALFRRDEYRERSKVLEELSQRYGQVPKWAAALHREREELAHLATLLKLTAAEVQDAEHALRSWPLPGGLLKKTDRHGRAWLSGERLHVFQTLEADSYGAASRVVHQKRDAIYMSQLQDQGLTPELLEGLRNIPVLRTATFQAAILSEINHVLPLPPSATKELRDAWAALAPAYDPAAEIYDIRYSALLR